VEAQVTVYPNGHDSTGISEELSSSRASAVQTIGASSFVSTQDISKAPPQTVIEIVPSPQISTEDLYASFENVSLELTSAVRLLSICLQHIGVAMEAQRNNNPIEADDAIQRLQGLLPELFCCRGLGDGFGLVINAIMCGFQNQAGNPLDRQQVEKLRQTIAKLRTEPFMREDEALNTIILLEDVGFVVEPPEFEYLADILDD
jgi:hypothetical protein